MRCILSLCVVVLFAVGGYAQKPSEWTVGDDKREAMVIAPTKKSDSPPLLFVFHGHGGTMQNMERKGFHKEWPEAVVVYPQGLATATPKVDPQGLRSGWQLRQGENKDRDLLFFDAMLKTMRETHKIDDKRIYTTGHSNGGAFTYLLGSARPNVFAAIAPSAAGFGGLKTVAVMKPIPMIHLGGEKDEIVPFANQQRSMDYMRKLNGCDADGKEWAKAGKYVATQYASKTGTPFVAAVHPGGHQFPDESVELIVKFCKEHAKK